MRGAVSAGALLELGNLGFRYSAVFAFSMLQCACNMYMLAMQACLGKIHKACHCFMFTQACRITSLCYD